MRSSTGISMYVQPLSVKKTVDSFNRIGNMFHKAISKVIQEAAIRIENDAKSNAPVDYGILRASIYRDYKNKVSIRRTQVSASPSAVVIPQGAAESDKDGMNAIIGSNLNYAIYMEEGRGPFQVNSAVNIPRVGWRYIGQHPGYKAQPFLQPAYNKTSPKIKPAIDKAIKEEIKKSTLR